MTNHTCDCGKDAGSARICTDCTLAAIERAKKKKKK
jgi:hypothetical protein